MRQAWKLNTAVFLMVFALLTAALPAWAALMGGSIQGTPLNLTNTNAVVTTLAGVTLSTGSTDGTGTAARFYNPYGITTPDGENLYIADANNSTIRKLVISTGQVTTIAGAAGVTGSTDGTGTVAKFNGPTGITTDGTNLFVTDSNNYTIRKMAISTGVVTTIAGSPGLYGSTDGTGSVARFYNAYDLTTDGANLYVADTSNHMIRKIVISTGQVTTLALAGAAAYGTTDGTGTAARFFYPYSITADGTNLYVTDSGNSTIRKVVISTGVVTTMAGSAGITGSTDGTGTAARFFWPRGITTDGGNLYVSDTDNATIRKIVISTGEVTTISGSAGSVGSTDGVGSSARFNWPAGINTDGINLFVSDNNNHTIRKIFPDVTSPTGSISINSGASYSNATSVTLTLSCTDTNGCSQMQFSNDNTNWSTAEAYASSEAWTLATGEGAKTVYVKFKDVAGNWSSAFSDTILLDTTAPTTAASPAGGTYTSAQSATLSCSEGSGAGCNKIYYTINGTTPTTSSTLYTGPISISSSTTHTFQNLENGKTYYVAVSSYDLNSGSRYTISSESEKTTSSGTPNDNDPPAAPSSLMATDAGTGGSIVLKWGREESFDIAGYVVAYKKTGNSVFEGITSTCVTWNYSVSGLTNGQSYTFYLYAYDSNGNFSDPSSVMATLTNSGSSADITPPGIPTLSAAPGNGKVTLMITPPSDTDIDHYNLYVYNLAAGQYMPLASINGLSYEHSTGVDNGKALVFVATAVDTSGNESGYSASASAVPNELPGDIMLEEDPPVLDRVDGYDVNETAKGFGSSIGKPNYNLNADLDGNGVIDGNDLLILGTNHGKKK